MGSSKSLANVNVRGGKDIYICQKLTEQLLRLNRYKKGGVTEIRTYII